MEGMTTLDTEVCLKTFSERYAEASQSKHYDNSSLPAGSPMFYYCKHCGVHTETLPESHWGAAKTVCDACKVLVDHGLIPEAVKRAKAELETSKGWSGQILRGGALED